MKLPAWPALQSIPVYPAVLAALFVTSRFLEGAEALQTYPRPLLAAVVIAIVVQALLTLVTRNRLIGGYFAATVMMLLVFPAVGMVLLAAGTVPLILGLRARRAIIKADWQRLTAALNLIAVLLLVVNAGLVATRAFAVATRAPSASVATPAPGLPSVYLLLLDGYPRADTLRDEYQFDNEPFLRSMEELGFDVARESYSNYNATILTLVSMFELKPVEVIPGGTGKPRNDEQVLISRLNHAPALAVLRDVGYRIGTIPSGLTAFTLYTADDVFDTGQVNGFEVGLARSGILPAILPDAQRAWFHDQSRERLTDSLGRMVQVSEMGGDRPRFVLTHVMSPHPPVVFAADGSPVAGNLCFPTACDLWADMFNFDIGDQLRGQLTHANRLVLDTMRRMIAADPDAVIVVFSDHGRRHDLANPTEMLHNLMLTRTPGRPDLFPADASPINVLPRILNAYAGTALPMAPEDSFVMDFEKSNVTGYFDLRPLAP